VRRPVRVRNGDPRGAENAANALIRLDIQMHYNDVSGEAHRMTGSEASRKTLREEVEALGDLRSHIENLHQICQGYEQQLLQKMVEDPGLNWLHQITQLYRSACSACEPPWDNFQEIRDRSLFWFHIGRLRVACELWRLRRMPRLCSSMALHSLQALDVLTPGVLDVL